MGHSNKEQWEKDLEKALQSFTSDWHEKVNGQYIPQTTTIKKYSNDPNHQSKAGKASAEVNSQNGQHEMFRQAGQEAIKQNFEEWREKVTQGGITAREKGIIQETQRRSSQAKHYCPICKRSGKGNRFLSNHFDMCGKVIPQKQKYIFRMYNDGVLVGEFPKLKDMAESFGCSFGHMSGMISGSKKSPLGWKFEKIDLDND